MGYYPRGYVFFGAEIDTEDVDSYPDVIEDIEKSNKFQVITIGTYDEPSSICIAIKESVQHFGWDGAERFDKERFGQSRHSWIWDLEDLFKKFNLKMLVEPTWLCGCHYG